MKKEYKKIFRQIDEKKPARDLPGKILARIHTAKRRSARIHFFALSALSTVSFVALFPAFRFTMEEFSRTGFYEFFSLAFSDTATILPLWKTFVLSLAETLPVLALAIFFSVLFILLESLRSAVKNASPAFFKFN